METIIGLVLNFIATIIAAIGLYYTIKKDDSPSLNILGHATLVNNDNSINVRVNDYYSNTGNSRNTKLNKIQSVLIEFINDSVKVINKFKKLALIIAAIFTFTHVITAYFDYNLLLTSHLKIMLNVNDSIWVYFFAYISLFIITYSSIMLIITAYYSKELCYQSRIRRFITTTKLTVLKEILTNKFEYRSFDEFPMKTLDKMMHNIVIESDNQANRVYNNKTKNPENKKPYTRSESVFFDNFYFKVVAVIVVSNVAYILFYPQANSGSYPPLSMPPATNIQHEEVCEYGRNKYISTSVNWRSGWKSSANILCDFTDLSTPNGFFILNSPDVKDISKHKNDSYVTVSGFVSTPSHKFYFTKHSYDSQNTKLVYIPAH